MFVLDINFKYLLFSTDSASWSFNCSCPEDLNYPARFHQLKLQLMETVLFMVSIIHVFLFFSYIVSAIMDGLQDNDAFKQNRVDNLNAVWASLMKDIKLWEDNVFF